MKRWIVDNAYIVFLIPPLLFLLIQSIIRGNDLGFVGNLMALVLSFSIVVADKYIRSLIKTINILEANHEQLKSTNSGTMSLLKGEKQKR